MELIEALQICLGYAITGETSHQYFFIFYGSRGYNGKSTLINMLHSILGSFSHAGAIEAFTKTKRANAGSASEHMTSNAGKRLIYVNDVPDNIQLDTGFLKLMYDPQSLREIHQKQREYNFYFKPFLNCNTLPRCTIVHIPFQCAFH